MFFMGFKYCLNKWQSVGLVLSLAAAPLIVNAAEIGINDFRITEEAFEINDSDVSYNSVDNQYLVIRVGSFNDGVLPSDKYEVYGQFIDAATGSKIDDIFRISFTGMDVVSEANVRSADITYNVTNNEFFIVWSASQIMNGEYEIYGLRVNATTGVAIGSMVRLSDMGPDGDIDYQAFSPAVTYNNQNNEYFVVWMGDDDTAPLINNEAEIFGQRVNANTGEEIGVDVRYSDMGPDGVTNFGAAEPAVAYNNKENEYLVVWKSDDNVAPQVDDEFEIFGQRVNAETGVERGSDIRLSDMGIAGSPLYSVGPPDVTYNSIDNEYYVVWSGDNGTALLGLAGEFEIYGRRVSGIKGKKLRGGSRVPRISHMGQDALGAYDASSPTVTYNINNNEYFVAWNGDSNLDGLVDNEFEIYGQRIAGTGAFITDPVIRLSDMGPDGNASYDAAYPSLSFNASSNEYLVIWKGRDDVFPSLNGKPQLYGQLLSGPATVRFVDATSSVNENDGSVQITVQRIGDTGNTVTVDFTTANGTATAPADYTTANGTLTFIAGETNKTFAIAISDNSDTDGDKTVNLSLSNAQANSGEVTLDSQSAASILTIVDDEAPASASGGGGGAFNPLMVVLIALLAVAGRALRQRIVTR